MNVLQDIITQILTRLDYGWTFILLVTRYFVFFILVPGLGGGINGSVIRYPAALMLAGVCMQSSSLAVLPSHPGGLIAQLISEVLLGGAIGLIPLLIVAGAQTAGHLASGTMGLNGAQLFDPATSTQLSDLSRIYSDLTIVIFLLVGGHHLAIAQLAGLNNGLIPGGFFLGEMGISTLIDQSARIFYIGCLVSAPVIVALLLTNFVMGIMSKAVPTINIFIISFPLTIGVGLALTILALPEVGVFLQREFLRLNNLFTAVLL